MNSSPGKGFRQPRGAQEDRTPRAEGSMRGRVCLVTGANRGIGKATALGVARLGATVVLLCRDTARGARALEEVRRESGNDEVALVAIDLGSFRSIHSAADEIRSRYAAVHVLVNNAGVNLASRALSE